MVRKTFSVHFLVILLMFCIGMYSGPIRIMGFNQASIPGDLGDGRLNNYFLEHGYKWITGHVTHFWDGSFFYPVARTITFSDNHLGSLPIYSFFRLMHFDRETAYQLWFIVLFGLNYFCCAWVLKKLSINTVGTAAGAYIFAFSLPIFGQIEHSQLLPHFMVPLAFFFALTFFEKPETKSFLLACLAVVIQFYFTMYMGFFLFLGLSAMLIAYIAFEHNRMEKLGRIAWGSSKSFLVKSLIVMFSIVCLLPLIIPYRRTSLIYGFPSWYEISLMLPRLRSYLYPANGSLLWGWLRPFGNDLPVAHEHQMFMGGVSLLALVVLVILSIRDYFTRRLAATLRKDTVKKSGKREIRKDSSAERLVAQTPDGLLQRGMTAVLSLVLLTLATLSMEPALYKWVMIVPGMNALRAITRIIFMDSFLMAFAVGVVVTRIAESKSIRSGRLTASVLSVVFLFAVVVDQFVTTRGLVHYTKEEAQSRSARIEKLVREKNPDAKIFAYMPVNSTDPDYIVHIDAMMAAQNLNISTINGYSGKFPKGYEASLFSMFDQCESYFIWRDLGPKINPRVEGPDLFKSMTFLGRPNACADDQRSYVTVNADLAQNGCEVTLTIPSGAITVVKGRPFPVLALVKNTSAASWGGALDGGRCQINLSYQWLSRDRSLFGIMPRSLPRDVMPGEQKLFMLNVNSPDKPGLYYLEFDPVQEPVTGSPAKGSHAPLLKVAVS